MKGKKHSPLIMVSVAMVLGYTSLILPPLLVSGSDEFKMPFPIYHVPILTNTRISGIISILCLTITGIVLGLLDSDLGPLWGFATMIPVAAISTVEFVFQITPHNLYPIEMFIYFAQSLPAFVGALLTRFIKRIFVEKPSEG